MKIFGPVLGAILAAAAIIAVIVWLRTGIVEHERVEKAFNEQMERSDAYLRAVKRVYARLRRQPQSSELQNPYDTCRQPQPSQYATQR